MPMAGHQIREGGTTCRVATFGRSELRENSTACHSSSTRFRREPTMPITCTLQTCTYMVSPFPYVLAMIARVAF